MAKRPSSPAMEWLTLRRQSRILVAAGCVPKSPLNCPNAPMQIDLDPSPSEQTLAAVRAGMRRYTESRVAWAEYSDLSLIARDEDGTVIGAALGETGRGWLNISVVW